MTTTTPTYPDLPAPAGARPDDWQDDSPLPYRVLFGESRGVKGRRDSDGVTVQASAIQFSDGRVDDGCVHEPPQIHIDDYTYTVAQAREFAARVIEAADLIDRWIG